MGTPSSPFWQCLAAADAGGLHRFPFTDWSPLRSNGDWLSGPFPVPAVRRANLRTFPNRTILLGPERGLSQLSCYDSSSGCAPSSSTNTDGIPSHLSGRVTLQKRTPGTTQFVRPAAVYLVHLPSPSPSLPWSAISTHAVSELTAHVDVLRANPSARLVLTALVLPSQGTVDAEIEAAARVRDLSLLQLANGKHAGKSEVVGLLNGVRDSGGGFVLTDEIRSTSSAFVAWEIQYQAHDEMKR